MSEDLLTNNPVATQDRSADGKLKRKTLNLNLSEPAYALLEELAQKTGKTRADVLRTGLALYGMADEAKDNGQGIGIIEGSEVVKEILIS
jgi:hypothetical protein